MTKNSATDVYFFDNDYYENLLKALGGDLWVGVVQDDAERTVSTALFMRHGNKLHYHLSGSTLEGARLGANNLLIWEASCYAREAGVELFHLGGGVAVDDPLWKFKESFGGKALSYKATGLVVNKSQYLDLAHQRARQIEIDPETTNPEFFPAYRTGLKT